MRITTKKSHYNARLGFWPKAALPTGWFAQAPFEDEDHLADEPLSADLLQGPHGVTDGHNTMVDTGFMDGLFIDKQVPISPLFARDLAGRAVYLGYGPEVKDNDEWAAYQVPPGPDGTIPPDQRNPLIPFVTFPRHCRDVTEMPGAELLEEILFCKFRCLEQPTGHHLRPSGATEDDESLAPVFNGANLYPYKLRPDTFYPDGYRLPQTQMLFARTAAQGVDVAAAYALGQGLLKAWAERAKGTDYAAWFEALGEAQLADLFNQGCTIIPTFEAHNGYAVVGRDFTLQDYWPGRAVLGLHDIADFVADKAPRGTILHVESPGYITATRVVPAVVVVSDGTGYVSPNQADPLPRIPNLNMPHSRTAANWRACYLPTHPEHFEAPALFGWDIETGKFLQIAGPLWAPLYYVYGCTDAIIDAYDFPEPYDPENTALVPVPPSLKGRFWPMVPLQGFDTYDIEARTTRRTQGSKISSIIVRAETPAPTAGAAAYHPLPMEFEVDMEPFWFPELHPLNRNHGPVPEALADRIAPVISPQVSAVQFSESVRGTNVFRGFWMNDVARLAEPKPAVLDNYPHLLRGLMPLDSLEAVLKLAPTPMLSDLGEKLFKPASQWWADDEATPIDTPAALTALYGVNGVAAHDALWDVRERGAELVKFRHMLYQTNLPLYIISYWSGATPEDMQNMLAEWIAGSEPGGAEGPTAAEGEAADAAALTAEESTLSAAEQAQLRALEAMSNAQQSNRLLPVAMAEEDKV